MPRSVVTPQPCESSFDKRSSRESPNEQAEKRERTQELRSWTDGQPPALLLVRAAFGPLHLVGHLFLDLFRPRRALLLLLPRQFRPRLRGILDPLLVHRSLLLLS